MNDRIKEFDGMRGIAVLLVIAFHFFKRADYFTNNLILHFITSLTAIGWIGVDMFFTLSGFLITNILLRTKGKENYFKNFYMRRILRILPIYFLMIMLVIAFAPKLERVFKADIFSALAVLLLFQQNWTAIFLDVPITAYLWVTWSLAVEEQFYFIWPFVVRRLSREALLKTGATVVVLSILARVVGVMFFEEVGKTSIHFFFYYSSFTRFEEMIIGALLAVLLTYDGLHDKIRKYAIPVFVTFLLIFLLMAVTSPVPPHPGYGYIPITIGAYTSIALFTAGLIAAFVTYPESALIRRPFQNKIMVFFGKYSYSMYLFHMPAAMIILDLLWHTGRRGWEMYVAYLVITFAVTTVIALLTWNLLEKHMLSLKKYFEYK